MQRSLKALLPAHGLRAFTASLFLVFSAALPTVHAQVPQAPEIAARSYFLLDVTANQILAAKDIDSPIEPASLTKLMTEYLVFDALKSKKIDLKQTFGVSERAWKMPGSRMFIDPKMKVPVEDLIKGMVVQSGNDATMALAEGVGGTAENFVRLMNEQAKALGMKSTGAPGGRRLRPIGLGTSSDAARANESQKLLNWGYTAFEAVKLFDAGQAVVAPAVWKGTSSTVKLGRPEAIVVAVAAGSAPRVKTQVARPDPLVAPFAKGQALGTLKVTLGDNPAPVAEVPLVALEAVEEAGILGRAWDAIRLWIK
jgi:D-alanyl-D-alanine carboxypeptidase